MAKFNEILTGRHNKLLTRLFSMKGPAPAPQLAGEIQPSLNLFHGRENRFLESWNIYWGNYVSVAQAAINSAIRFRNPLNSNVIAVLEKLQVNAAAAVSVSSNLTFSTSRAGSTIDFTNVFIGVSGDTRNIGNSSLVPSGSVGATIDLGFVVWLAVTQGNADSYEHILDNDQQIVLVPGDTLQIRDVVVNEQIRVNALWRERALEESELRQ